MGELDNKCKMKRTFFSLNKKTALNRLRELQKVEPYYKKFKKVRLAKYQVSHILNWKTWEYY
jgi:hypothetical protein